MDDASRPPVVFAASVYRALAAAGDARAARSVAARLAAAERERGARAAASPYVLWELLAACAPRANAPDDARAAVARAALAACAAHCAFEAPNDPPTGSPNESPGDAPDRAPGRLALAEGPDGALCRAVVGAIPPAVTAWDEYVASLASEIAANPSAERAARLAGPLRHVRRRARQAADDFADEVQDAVAAAYEAAAPGWDPSASSADRQRALAAGGASVSTAVLARDPLARAAAAGRARRARRVAAGQGAHSELFDGDVDEALLADAARVVERFPAGVALFRELLRRVIAGELDLTTLSGRRWFWDAQVAFAAPGLAVAEQPAVLGAAAGGVLALAAYVQRLGAEPGKR